MVQGFYLSVLLQISRNWKGRPEYVANFSIPTLVREFGLGQGPWSKGAFPVQNGLFLKSKNGPKVDYKWSKNGPKMALKGLKMVQDWKNRPKRGQR